MNYFVVTEDSLEFVITPIEGFAYNALFGPETNNFFSRNKKIVVVALGLLSSQTLPSGEFCGLFFTQIVN